jgi:predicted negative regulator of RcsB-dependent stress response
MKRKEKEHLKTDPFVHFFEKAVLFYKNNRRFILLGAGVAALVVIILVALLLFRNMGSLGENKTYAEAFRVRTAENMSVDEKIAKLQEMKFKKGISAAGQLFIAALQYEKGDLAKAEATLAAMPKSRVAMINDDKNTLYAQVLVTTGKTAEAEAMLKGMLHEKKTVMAKELILMQLAKMQAMNKQNAEAVASLKQLISEYPDTPSAMEAQTLLAKIEGVAASGQ